MSNFFCNFSSLKVPHFVFLCIGPYSLAPPLRWISTPKKMDLKLSTLLRLARLCMGKKFKTPNPHSSCKTVARANITFLDVQILVAYGQILLSAWLCKKHRTATSVSVYEWLYRTSYLIVIINTSICRISNNSTNPNLPPLWVCSLGGKVIDWKYYLLIYYERKIQLNDWQIRQISSTYCKRSATAMGP